MSERWIVGTDGSDGSDAALRWALRRSADRDVHIELVHADGRSAARRLASAVLERLPGRRAGGSGVGDDHETVVADAGDGREIVRHVTHGPAGRVLVTAASDAALLVVGRHGSGGGWRNVLGSVSRYCVNHAPVPTVVVPPAWADGGFGRIVVGFDGSANSCAALKWAVGFADGREVRALIAIQAAPWLQEDLVQIRLGEELEAERVRLLDLLAAADPEGRAILDIQVRGAKPALAGVAGSTDLIVVGARGAGLMAGLGSVSTWLLDSSPCPVAVVPETARA